MIFSRIPLKPQIFFRALFVTGYFTTAKITFTSYSPRSRGVCTIQSCLCLTSCVRNNQCTVCWEEITSRKSIMSFWTAWCCFRSLLLSWSSLQITPLLLVTDHAHGGFTFDSSEIAVVLATAGVIQFFYQVTNLPFLQFWEELYHRSRHIGNHVHGADQWTCGADFLNAVYFIRGLTCTLGSTNNLVDGLNPMYVKRS